MKLKILCLIFLLCLPQLGSAYYVCHPCCSRFQLPGWWLSADYLLLWRKQRFFPPLVTTNPNSNPILSDPTTTILFGDEFIGGKPQSGWRCDLGLWMTRCLGFGGGGFNFGQEKITFQEEGNGLGSPIIGRPFFNTVTGLQDADRISFPFFPFQAVNGRIKISTNNKSWGYDLYGRYRFFASPCFKFDLLGGYSFNLLEDALEVKTRTTRPAVLVPSSLVRVEEFFHARNEFNAGLIGFYSEWRSRNWGITVTGKAGIGRMTQRVNIQGLTFTTINGTTTMTQGGLLAQPSNIGEHTSNQFSVVSQINTELQLRIAGHLWFTAGYTYMFWPAVVLAGEQVNLDINPTQVPGPTVGTPSPLFNKVNKSFWVQGLTAGFYIFY